MTDTRLLFQLALVAGAAWVIYLLAPMLTPFLVSALLAYLGNPAVNCLARWHFPRPLAVALVFLLFLLLVIVLLFFLIPALQAQITSFITKAPSYFDWLQHTALPRLQALLGIELSLDVTALRQTLLGHWREVGDWATAFLLYITRSGLSIIGWLATALLVPVVTFYLLLDWDGVLARVLSLFPSRRRHQVAALARESDEVLGSFLRGQLLVMTALAVVYSVGLTLVGLDLALPIGIVAGLVSFVPYLGFILGLLSAAIAAYLQFQDPMILLGVGIVFLAGQMLESLWLTPKLVGNRIGLHPVAVIFAVMAGGQLFGFTGILLALPTAAVLKIWLRHLRDFSPGQANGQSVRKRRKMKRPSP
ncbi:MAG: AI-2E family transporter [Gammaproteobacteria bacterium]|nr:AI-2E family transporter [Gammaproteobacteria bacterium]MDH5488035.1 AI-2E family transporter [Gammaproteobacteria bacterium]